MNPTRRSFLQRAVLASATVTCGPQVFAAPGRAGIQVGTCGLDLERAKAAGLAGVQVGVGGGADELEIIKPATRARYKEQMRATGLPICSFMMALLNQFPLASDPRGPAWLAQSIDAAKDLGVSNILLAFFGDGDLQAGGKLKEDAFAAAVRRVRDAAPRAKDAGVTLAIENMLTAEQNLKMLDEIGHESVSLYYDVYNTGKTQKYKTRRRRSGV